MTFILLDSTLREGEQSPGVNFTIQQKLEIARMLDEVGVEMIEAGDPNVSVQVSTAIQEITALGLKAEIVGHCLASKAGIDRARKCNVGRVAIVYPVSKIHMETKLGKTETEVIEVVQEHVAYARSLGLKVRFTPEDATRAEESFLVEVCNAAIQAGADRISVADTLGVMQPEPYYSRVKKLKDTLLPCALDVHCHNDFGLALANAMAGIRAGANCIHVTVNGLGERAGIPDLAETILAYHVLEGVQKYHLPATWRVSQYVEQVTGFRLPPNKPITGSNAFSHKSGIHSNGVLKNPGTYEPFDPALLGRDRAIVISQYTGESAVRSKLAKYGITLEDGQIKAIVERLKNHSGETSDLPDETLLTLAQEVVSRTS